MSSSNSDIDAALCRSNVTRRILDKAVWFAAMFKSLEMLTPDLSTGSTVSQDPGIVQESAANTILGSVKSEPEEEVVASKSSSATMNLFGEISPAEVLVASMQRDSIAEYDRVFTLHPSQHDLFMHCIFQISENRIGGCEITDAESVIKGKMRNMAESMIEQKFAQLGFRPELPEDRIEENVIQGCENWVKFTAGLDTDKYLKPLVDFYIGVLASASQSDGLISLLRNLSTDLGTILDNTDADTYTECFVRRIGDIVGENRSFLMPIISCNHACYALWEQGTDKNSVLLSLHNGGEGSEYMHTKVMLESDINGNACKFLESCIYELPLCEAKLFIAIIGCTRGLESIFKRIGEFLCKWKDCKVCSTRAFRGQYDLFPNCRVCIREQEVGNCTFHNLRAAITHYEKGYDQVDGTTPMHALDIDMRVFESLHKFLKTNIDGLSKTYGSLIMAQAANVLHGFHMQFLPQLVGTLRSIDPKWDPMTSTAFPYMNDAQRAELHRVSTTDENPRFSESHVNLPYIQKLDSNHTDRF